MRKWPKATRVSDKLKKIDDRLTDFLAGVRELNELVPDVTYALDRVRWERTVLDTRPPEANMVPISSVEEETAFALAQIETVLPRVPKFDFNAARDGVNS